MKNLKALLIFGMTAFFFLGPLRAEEGLDFNVPVPSGSVLIKEQSGVLSGRETRGLNYQSDQSRQAIVSFYRSFFSKNRFVSLKDAELARGLGISEMRFKKGELVVHILVSDIRGQARLIAITKYLQREGEPDLAEYPLYTPGQAGQPPDMANLPEALKGIYQADTSKIDPKILKLEIPAPPGAKLTSTQAMALLGKDMLTSNYSCAQAPEEVANFYRRFFKGKGFSPGKESEVEKMGFRKMRFKKQDIVVDIMAMATPAGTDLAVAKYLQPEGSPDIEESQISLKDSAALIPKEDGPGQDLSNMPRVPQSVRWTRMDLPGGVVSLLYSTSLTVAKAKDFFISKMPSYGWQVAGETSTRQAVEAYKKESGKKSLGETPIYTGGENLEEVISDSYILKFRGQDGSADITIFPNYIDRKLGSLVSIKYTGPQR